LLCSLSGHPLYTIELVSLMQEKKLVPVENRVCKLTDAQVGCLAVEC
jgi:hypothetical protein